ncbi:assimilatory sulfite reductase (NADPH) flavoprotein subunit [Lysinibacillus sp. BW-2-10]|uniref:assimilatory sulfite reductase (NADPH) flavoprotein subunit n=1 Tax=Lysinibacillus sp. BW-2-10 TaxID=2590030 RepID=UPI00117CFD11|nr:assimilatory sulfite reductase (NADPH) flavoprotein subunit [Lysinibacillus sp. BW-2-10]TSI03053.1 assimilatory sulfite reductase (NADPH) flavoprotein subunit [Lysinibacillus sp. BW-2-10]
MKLEVNNSPFNEQQVTQLNELIRSLTTQQKIWLTGYLSATSLEINVGTVEQNQSSIAVVPAQAPAAVQAKAKDITVLFASQTGTAQGLAKKYGEQLKELGFEVNVSSMSDFKTNNLKKLDHLLVIASTHGEGEPPDNAIAFYNFLQGKRAPKLDHVNYSVLSLGDSSYEFFCQTGKDFDAQLEKLGANRIVDRVDCDLDFDEQATAWFESVKGKLQEGAVEQTLSEKEAASTVLAIPATEYSRNNPFHAEVLEKINLNGEGSNKETIHLELSLEESGLTYEPGDSLAILPTNNENLVNSLIQALSFDANKSVTVGENVVSLQEALTNVLDITTLSKPVLEKISEFTANNELQELLQNRDELKQYIYGRDLLDVVEKFGPFTWDEQSFVTTLRKLPSRQYSISSSQAAYPEEVHVTIGAVRYEVDGRQRLGVCSTEIADRIEVGDKVRVYVQQSPNFKLPSDETPIIMIGPGTGIAPFRSFIQEREERGAQGQSWLFFGDQHFVTDFLYQTEWQRWLKDGVLTKLNVAFSRDQEEKVYVQHKIEQHAQEVYEWLQQGAVVYVCGDKDHMAKDVHETLINVIAKQGNKSKEEAEEYLTELKAQKRYQRDVY